MLDVFVNLGSNFRDKRMLDFAVALSMPCEKAPEGRRILFVNHAVEQIGVINELADQDAIIALYFETTDCDNSPNRIRAIGNLMTLICANPSVVMLMPISPRDLVEIAAEQFPDSDIWVGGPGAGDKAKMLCDRGRAAR